MPDVSPLSVIRERENAAQQESAEQSWLRWAVLDWSHQADVWDSGTMGAPPVPQPAGDPSPSR
jgi:hypothetical protein